MSPEQVTEGQNDTWHEPGGETGKANGSALERGGAIVRVMPDLPDSTNTFGQDKKPPEEVIPPDPSDLISEEILSQAPPMMQNHLQMLQEQYESCMQMHRHYKEIAVNGTEADVGPTSADDMALNYLRQASQISQNMTTMINEMLRTSTKKTLEREKLRGRAKVPKIPDVASVTQNNTVINFSEADQRTRLRMMDQVAGNKKMNGSLGIPDAQTLISTITNTGDYQNDEDQPDVAE